jgi:hypothetical protein
MREFLSTSISWKLCIIHIKTMGKSEKTPPQARTKNRFLRGILSYKQQHPNIVLAAGFVFLWVFASLIFYSRFPNAFHYANFFAEDGQHFALGIIEDGFLKTAFTTFNGYFIMGVYALIQVGMVVNSLLFGGQFVNLPQAFAIVSYGFLGLCAALPFVLLRRYMTWPYRVGLALLIALMPMPALDYTTIGTIGNLKFAFVYIAFLLVLYRITLPRNSRKILAVDAALLLGVYTTAGVYFVLPFALLGDGLKPSQLLKKKQWKKLFRPDNVALWSFVLLGALAFIQVAYIALKGVPENPGYLDAPFQAAKAIEVFVARSYLYPAVAAGYSRLNDVLVVLLFAATVVSMWFWGRKENRRVYLFGLFIIFTTSAVFIANRTGVTAGFDSYKSSQFDNFFYTQNFIFCVIGVLLLADLSRRFAWFRKFGLGMVVITVVLVGMQLASSKHATNDYMQYKVGPLKEQTHEACRDKDTRDITFSVYPFDTITMTRPRAEVCTPAATEYVDQLDDFGLEFTPDSKPINIEPSNSPFYQTFVANENTVRGVAVYLGTYSETRAPGYHFTLLDKDCKQTLRSLPMSKYVSDNSYQTITFYPIENAKGKTFCFSVVPEDQKRPMPKLAVLTTPNDEYREGRLKVGDTTLNQDVIFQVLY